MKRPSRIQKLNELFSREHHNLYLAALAITRHRACAEDAVQDALIAVAEVDSDLENLKCYLYRSVRNRALYLAQRQDRLCELDDNAQWIVGDTDNLESKLFAEQVSQHLAELETKYREVLVLKLYSDFTFNEIATVTGHPQNTVASWYRRGLAQLKEKLDEQTLIARSS